MSAALVNICRTGAVVGACNAVGYAITAALETHKITDLVGAGSFVAATVALSHKNGLFVQPLQYPKLALVNLGVAVWGTRLASFLFQRVLQVGEDKRLNKFFRKPGEAYLDSSKSFFPIRLGLFWTIQAAWGFLCLLPVSMMNAGPAAGPAAVATITSLAWKTPMQAVIHWAPVAGLFAGIAIEATADAQKNAYRNDKRNDGHWCDRGLWKLSRYPNYFGELVTWWSVYFAALPTLRAAAPSAMIPFAPAVALVSPLFITYLLLKLSGIPLLERKYEKQYAGNKEFERYQKETPLLVPNPLLAFRSASKRD